MKIINKKNLNNILDLYKNKTELIIFGKGPSFQQNIKKDDHQIFACVNNSINYVDNCDFLIINDLHNIDKLSKDKFKNVPNFVIPYHIHVLWTVLDNFTFKNVIDKIKDDFDNNLIIFNLITSKKIHDDYITLNTGFSSAHCIAELFIKFMPNINTITTYGIGNGSGYHQLFKKLQTKEHTRKFANSTKSSFFNRMMKKLVFKKNIKLNIN